MSKCWSCGALQECSQIEKCKCADKKKLYGTNTMKFGKYKGMTIQDVREAALKVYQGEPLNEPVCIRVEFIFPRPQGHFGTGKNSGKLKPSAPIYATSHSLGDLDKLLRSTFDGLSVAAGGTVIRDDSLIVETEATKRYAMNEEYIGANIKIETFS